MRIAVYTLLTALIFISLTGCSVFNGSEKDKNESQKINKTPKQLRYEELNEEIERDFDDAEAHYQLARLYMTDRRYSKAEYELNIALNFKPMLREAQAAQVKVNQQLGNDSKSAQLADIYINQTKSKAEEALLLGQAFQNEGLDDYAFDCYQNALALAPDSAVLNKQVGYYYLDQGDRSRAEVYLKKSIQLNPYQPDVSNELGKMGVSVEVPKSKKSSGFSLDRLFKKNEEKSGQQ
ncbi:tetratricopeptide repeat protein [Sedimentisphaera salicampi]|uniref:tetratricopeptide repeat protein n=1 Tax=Sedimentisphaera salicampi TaxID=1941349 RepID=UPI000B9A937C|nr:hypothetical protein [Sedimentisphaera salicampi]OXU15340.1 putative PEP-CTERM system TPR-repeat lipoprotein [Sedimentisphaera salicampi]